MPKSTKRKWIKNVSRICMISFTLLLALSVWTQISVFLELIGALTCAPLAFILPALFHYKIAKTSRQKCIDMTIVIVSIVLALFCTFIAIQEWIEAE